MKSKYKQACRLLFLLGMAILVPALLNGDTFQYQFMLGLVISSSAIVVLLLTDIISHQRGRQSFGLGIWFIVIALFCLLYFWAISERFDGWDGFIVMYPILGLLIGIILFAFKDSLPSGLSTKPNHQKFNPAKRIFKYILFIVLLIMLGDIIWLKIPKQEELSLRALDKSLNLSDYAKRTENTTNGVDSSISYELNQKIDGDKLISKLAADGWAVNQYTRYEYKSTGSLNVWNGDKENKLCLSYKENDAYGGKSSLSIYNKYEENLCAY